MHPSDLFKRIHTRDNYRHIGKELSYKFFFDWKDKIIYCCFQGSNGLLDWLHNFLFKPEYIEPYEGCGFSVHGGFARVWRSGDEAIMNEAKFYTRVMFGWRLVFCGFSHGGPLAMLAAWSWYKRTKRLSRSRPKCVIFGSPKLAWGYNAMQELSESMRLTNWINKADIVTRLPLETMGFRHINQRLVNVRRVPILSLFRVSKHHQIYDRKEIYP